MQITSAPGHQPDPMLLKAQAAQRREATPANAPGLEKARAAEVSSRSTHSVAKTAPVEQSLSADKKPIGQLSAVSTAPEHAKKLLDSLSALPREAQPRVDGAATVPGPHEQQQTGAQMYTVTMKGLKAAWGTDNPLYDLTGSGTVDVFDMLELVRNGGTMEVPMQEVDTPLTLEGLIAAWGTNNPRYDLTGSGTVDIFDLLEFIKQYESA